MIDDPIVIAAGARTPMGSFQGELASVTAPELGGAAIAAARAGTGEVMVAGAMAIERIG